MDLVPAQRRQQIAEMFRQKAFWTISELAERFGVSTATIHRDLGHLEARGVVSRTHGGAEAKGRDGLETWFDIRARTCREEKTEIAKKAVQLIEPASSIFIDASSTCSVLADEISRSFSGELTIVTNSPFALTRLYRHRDFHVVCPGGELQFQLCAIAGPMTTDFLSRLHFDQAFISAGAFSPDRGLMTSQVFIVEVLRTIFAVSSKVNLLVDHTKFHKLGMLEIAPATAVHRIVTDAKTSAEQIEQCRRLGIEVII